MASGREINSNAIQTQENPYIDTKDEADDNNKISSGGAELKNGEEV
jgi:hypothetical protein